MFPWWLLPTVPAGFILYDQLYRRFRTWQADNIQLAKLRANAMRHITPQDTGQIGVMIDGQAVDGRAVIRNLDDRSAFTATNTISTDELAFRINRMERLMLASAQGRQPPQRLVEQLEAELPPAPAYSTTTIGGLIAKYNHRPSLRSILIGETINQDTNQLEPLCLDIPNSVHVLCTGASGLGKSTLMESIAMQLATIDDVKLAAIDYGSGTFDFLDKRLGWTLADNPELAVGLIVTLTRLCQERKAKYEQVGRVRSLAQYNTRSGEHLPFVVLAIDETPPLMKHPGTKQALTELLQMGRKYGVGVLVGGTDFKVDTLPSDARGNCQARIAFWLEPGLSRSVFNSNIATEIEDQPGFAVCRRPGKGKPVQCHTPDVVDGDYRVLGLDSSATIPKTVIKPANIQVTNQPTDAQIWQAMVDLAKSGKRFSCRQVEKTVFGYAGGGAHAHVKAVAQAHSTELSEMLKGENNAG